MAYFKKRELKRGGISWMARVRVKGFPPAVATFEKLSEAKSWAGQVQLDYHKGRYSQYLRSQQYTAGQMIDRYLENVLESKTTKKRYIEGQRAQLLWWKKEIGQFTLSNLTLFVIAEKIELLAGSNFALRQPGTINRYLAALSHVINTAIKSWGWLTENPVIKVKKPKEPRGRTRFLSDSEREKLLAASLVEKRKPLFLIIFFAICTGARKGEILVLKLADTDLTLKRCIVYETKNGEPRQLHLSEQLAEALADYLETRTNSRSPYLFCSRINPNKLNIEVEWRRCLARAKIADFRFHDLRHSFASYLAMNKASLADIAEALGHKSLGLVKRYAHMTQTHTASVIADMNAKIFNPQPQQGAA